MAEIRDYSTSPDPQTADRWPENMAMSSVNDTGRDDEGIIARWYRDERGDLADTGSANAYFVTANRSLVAYDGLNLTFIAANTNTGASTLAVAGAIGATNILSKTRQPLKGGEIQANSKIHVIHAEVAGGSGWILMSGGVAETQEINVKDFGAVGDGTTDDTTAFTNAESARSSLGWKKVNVPEGTYSLTAAPDWSTLDGPGDILVSGNTIPAGEINATVDLNVPSVFTTIESAWDYLKPRAITMNGLARIVVADGTYNLANRLRAEHPNGAKISMRGNDTTPANCILNFTHGGSEDGIFVGNGYSLGLLSGFQIQLAAKPTSPNVGSGIIADTNGSIICGVGTIRVQNWYFGIAARNGGHVRATGAWVRDCADTGIIGILGGSVSAEDADVADITDAPNSGLGTGILGEAGGVVLAAGATAANCQLWLIAQANDGHVRITLEGATGETERVVAQTNQLQGRGDAADVDVAIIPQGGGYVQIGGPFISSSPSVNGFIRIKDSNGNIYRMLCAANA